MFCGPLAAHLPQIVQHYPYLTEKSFDPQARWEKAKAGIPFAILFSNQHSSLSLLLTV